MRAGELNQLERRRWRGTITVDFEMDAYPNTAYDDAHRYLQRCANRAHGSSRGPNIRRPPEVHVAHVEVLSSGARQI